MDLEELICLIDEPTKHIEINILDLGSNFIYEKLGFLFKSNRKHQLRFTYTPVDIKQPHSIYSQEYCDKEEAVSIEDWIQRTNRYCLQEKHFDLIDKGGMESF